MNNRFFMDPDEDPTEPLAKLEQATKIAGLGHYIWDVVADRCLYCSEQHAANHGMDVDGYVARASTLNGLAHPEDISVVRQSFAELRKGKPFEIDYRVVTPDGDTRVIREIGHPVFDDQSNVVQEIGTSQDITRQSALESELRAAQASLQTSIEALPLGFAAYDRHGILQTFNQNYRMLLPQTAMLMEPGIRYEDLLNVTAGPVSKACGFDSPEAYVAKRLAATKTLTTSWTYQQTSGRWVKVATHPNADGGFISIVEDITLQKTQENQLLQAQKIEAIGQLTGGIAHDFNNLLAVIQGNAELLVETETATAPLVNDIVAATKRGSELTRSLLAFARRQVLTPKPIDLGDLAMDFARVLRRTFGEDITVRVVTEPGLSNAFADRAQIESALLNLALNARAAMPAGGTLTISCGQARPEHIRQFADLETADKSHVILVVSDTGVGMNADQIAHAFEPFYTTKGVGEGSGLGLSMVYGFAQQSGGALQIKSREGEGTTIELILPATEVPAATDSTHVTHETARGAGELILIVEDDPSVQNLVRKQLQRLNYRTLCASDGVAAAAAIETSPDVDLVLSDVVLPGGISGPQLARSFQKSGVAAKFLFMSGHAKEDLGDLAEFGPNVQLLSKPFLQVDLANAVQSSLCRT